MFPKVLWSVQFILVYNGSWKYLAFFERKTGQLSLKDDICGSNLDINIRMKDRGHWPINTLMGWHGQQGWFGCTFSANIFYDSAT